MLVLVVHCSRWLRLWMSKGNANVHQWLLTFDLEPSWDLSSLAQVNLVKQELGERCPQICRSISLSSRVSDVAKALQRSFPDYAITWEHQDSTSGYSIDMRVEGNHAGTDVVWAVEVDGPSHFLQVRSTLSWVVLTQIPQCSFISRPYH